MSNSHPTATIPSSPRGHLPRLEAGWYRDTAVVFWTHTIVDRVTAHR